ncbi:hypothetical protein GCM10022221_23060 [Actinocorallia aurea]
MRGLPLPGALVELLADGSWRHPGDAVLAEVVPWFAEPLDFLTDVARMRRESRSLDVLEGDFFRIASGGPGGRPVELPWLDARSAVLIAVNRELGADLALALDYRTGLADPRVVGSDFWTDPGRCAWRVVAPSFWAFAAELGLAPFRRYPYVGPEEIRERALVQPRGKAITSSVGLAGWLARQNEPEEPFTFVVDGTGTLLLAPRRSEHVACAGGGAVLSAGEIAFERDGVLSWGVGEVSNQSTGYCPEPSSWPAVGGALDRAGIAHPGGFTAAFVFRRCVACRQLNIVKDGHYRCAVCDGRLPDAWEADLVG